MGDIFQRITTDPVMSRVEAAEAAGLYPYFRALSSIDGPTAHFEGREVIMLGSNNYLGLTIDERVRRAAAQAVASYGTSVTGSRFLNGTLDIHLELERRLASFLGKPSALVFTTGYQTILGVITALVRRNDVVLLDRDAHASAIDGSRMSLGHIRRFRHNDPSHLDHLLASLPAAAGKLVVVDGVYSMMGDLAPLPGLITVCRRHRARLLLDDAHGVGVMGGGRGTAHHFGATDDIDLIVGTFSKSFASVGGFVAGSRRVIDYIKHVARPFIYSASLPPANVATVLAALDILTDNPGLVTRLHQNAAALRTGLASAGYPVSPSPTPIIPVVLEGPDQYILGTWKQLIESGVYVNPVVPPAVPEGTGMLRLSVTACHLPEHLEHAVSAFRTLKAHQ